MPGDTVVSAAKSESENLIAVFEKLYPELTSVPSIESVLPLLEEAIQAEMPLVFLYLSGVVKLQLSTIVMKEEIEGSENLNDAPTAMDPEPEGSSSEITTTKGKKKVCFSTKVKTSSPVTLEVAASNLQLSNIAFSFSKLPGFAMGFSIKLYESFTGKSDHPKPPKFNSETTLYEHTLKGLTICLLYVDTSEIKMIPGAFEELLALDSIDLTPGETGDESRIRLANAILDRQSLSSPRKLEAVKALGAKGSTSSCRFGPLFKWFNSVIKEAESINYVTWISNAAMKAFEDLWSGIDGEMDLTIDAKFLEEWIDPIDEEKKTKRLEQNFPLSGETKAITQALSKSI